MTVMVFQLEGSDQTLQEGIRTISGAIQGMVKPARALALPVGAPPQPGDEPEPEVADDVPGNGDDAEIITEKAEGRRTAPPRSPEVLHDLQVPADELRKFCEAKGVGTNDRKRYLVIAAFLTERMSIHAITMDHIHTCYRLLDWNTPTDAGGPLRALKSKGRFQKGEGSGTYILNHVGENAVRNMSKDAP